jgi:hypothetical protein
MNEKTYNESKCNNNIDDKISCNSVETEIKTNSTNNISLNNNNKKSKQNSSNSNIKKFNRYFQTKLTNNERVINVFSCALQRNDNHLLIHGTLFVTCKYYAFYSNIFGYQTKFEGKWYDVLNIKKENIALVFPTAIKIELNNNQKIVLASFIARNNALDCIVNVWKTAQFNKKIKNESKKQHQQNYKPTGITDENNNETEKILENNNLKNTNNAKEIRNRHTKNNSSLSSSSNYSLSFENTENIQPQKMSDTSSLTSSLATNMSTDETKRVVQIEDVTELNDSSSTGTNTTNEKRYYKQLNILYRIKFFLNFIITIIINNSLHLKTIVLTISTSITSLTSITTISTEVRKHQIQQQSQIQNNSSFNNLAVIIIFLIILSILYLYVFIILTQINHIEEKLVNLYKKLNF